MSQSKRVRGIKLKKIAEVLDYDAFLDGRSKKVRLECGHVVTCHTGSINRARCRACEYVSKHP